MIAVILVTTVGLVMVFSATAADAARESGEFTEQFHLLIRQGISLVVGLVAMGIGLSLPYRFWRGWFLPLSLVTIFVMLALLLFPNPFRGEPGPGGIAYRWLLDGPLRFQPAEFAKIIIVLYAAHYLDRKAPHMSDLRNLRLWIPYLAVGGAMAVMILKEPDLGTTLVVAGVCFFMLWAANIDWKLLTLGFIGGLGAVYLAARLSPYRWLRITSWMYPWADAHGDAYQAVQGMIALARGGVFGSGLGQGVQKLGYLPEKHTDFIFAVIAEEMGLVGNIALLALFAVIAWRGYRSWQRRRTGSAVCSRPVLPR